MNFNLYHTGIVDQLCIPLEFGMNDSTSIYKALQPRQSLPGK